MMNETIDNTRRLASDALERASSTMKGLRSGMSDRASTAMEPTAGSPRRAFIAFP